MCILAGVAALAAGCGSATVTTSGEAGSDRQPVTIVVAPGTHRFDPKKVRTGDTLRCRGGAAGAVVPDPGHGVGGNADGVTESSSIIIDNRGDVVVVTCEVS
jgi:hypothetical protein